MGSAKINHWNFFNCWFMSGPVNPYKIPSHLKYIIVITFRIYIYIIYLFMVIEYLTFFDCEQHSGVLSNCYFMSSSCNMYNVVCIIYYLSFWKMLFSLLLTVVRSHPSILASTTNLDLKPKITRGVVATSLVILVILGVGKIVFCAMKYVARAYRTMFVQNSLCNRHFNWEI